jgi:hypothetical protein
MEEAPHAPRVAELNQKYGHRLDIGTAATDFARLGPTKAVPLLCLLGCESKPATGSREGNTRQHARSRDELPVGPDDNARMGTRAKLQFL